MRTAATCPCKRYEHIIRAWGACHRPQPGVHDAWTSPLSQLFPGVPEWSPPPRQNLPLNLVEWHAGCADCTLRHANQTQYFFHILQLSVSPDTRAPALPLLPTTSARLSLRAPALPSDAQGRALLQQSDSTGPPRASRRLCHRPRTHPPPLPPTCPTMAPRNPGAAILVGLQATLFATLLST